MLIGSIVHGNRIGVKNVHQSNKVNWQSHFDHSRCAVAKDKPDTVSVLGGSITEMDSYRRMIPNSYISAPFSCLNSMPVLCDTTTRCLSQDEFGRLDYSVMGHAFSCQNDLGRLAHEQIYQNDLKARLVQTGIAAEGELKVSLIHDEYVKSLFIDLVVDQGGIYEFKTVASLVSQHEVQLLTYLYLLDLLHGKLINFRTPQLETRFVNAMIPRRDRIGFQVCANAYSGPAILFERTVALLRDWGTCLNLSLYQDALIYFLGGVGMVQRLLKLNRGGNDLGSQRFHLVSDDEAFLLTALSAESDSYDKQVERLLSLSPLRAIHRINITAHQVSFRTTA